MSQLPTAVSTQTIPQPNTSNTVADVLSAFSGLTNLATSAATLLNQQTARNRRDRLRLEAQERGMGALAVEQRLPQFADDVAEGRIEIPEGTAPEQVDALIQAHFMPEGATPAMRTGIRSRASLPVAKIVVAKQEALEDKEDEANTRVFAAEAIGMLPGKELDAHVQMFVDSLHEPMPFDKAKTLVLTDMLTAARIRGDTPSFNKIAAELVKTNPLEVEKQRPMVEERARKNSDLRLSAAAEDLLVTASAFDTPAEIKAGVDLGEIGGRHGLTPEEQALFNVTGKRVIEAETKAERARIHKEVRNEVAKAIVEGKTLNNAELSQLFRQKGLDAENNQTTLLTERNRLIHEQERLARGRRDEFDAEIGRQIRADPQKADPAKIIRDIGVTDADEASLLMDRGLQRLGTATAARRKASNDKFIRDKEAGLEETAVKWHFHSIISPEFDANNNPASINNGIEEEYTDNTGAVRTFRRDLPELNRKAYQFFKATPEFIAKGDPGAVPGQLNEAQRKDLLAFNTATKLESPDLRASLDILSDRIAPGTEADDPALRPHVESLEFWFKATAGDSRELALKQHTTGNDEALHAFRMTRILRRANPEMSTAQAFITYINASRTFDTRKLIIEPENNEAVTKVLATFSKDVREDATFRDWLHMIDTAHQVMGIRSISLRQEELRRVAEADTVKVFGRRFPTRGLEQPEMAPRTMNLIGQWYLHNHPEAEARDIGFAVQHDQGILVLTDPTGADTLVDSIRVNRREQNLIATVLSAITKRDAYQRAFDVRLRERARAGELMHGGGGAAGMMLRPSDGRRRPAPPHNPVEGLFEQLKGKDLGGGMTLDWILSQEKEIKLEELREQEAEDERVRNEPSRHILEHAFRLIEPALFRSP